MMRIERRKKDTFPYVHHFWVTFTIGAIEQVQDLLFECFTVFVNRLSSLNGLPVIGRPFVQR